MSCRLSPPASLLTGSIERIVACPGSPSSVAGTVWLSPAVSAFIGSPPAIQRPSLVMPMGSTSYLSLSMASITERAERSETVLAAAPAEDDAHPDAFSGHGFSLSDWVAGDDSPRQLGQRPTLCRRNHIAEHEAIALDDLAHRALDRVLKDRAIEDEGVELPIFAAWVNFRREVLQQCAIKEAPGKRSVQMARINAGEDRLEAHVHKRAGQGVGVLTPDREDGLHPDPGKIPLAVLAHIFEEQVAEGVGRDPLRLEGFERLPHPRLVDLIGAILGDVNFVQRDTDSLGLLFEQRPPDGVHTDPIIALGQRRQQSGDFDAGIAL